MTIENLHESMTGVELATPGSAVHASVARHVDCATRPGQKNCLQRLAVGKELTVVVLFSFVCLYSSVSYVF